jgi:hypothetical protein
VTTPLPVPLNPPGPAQSDFLIHFCGRPVNRPNTPSVPARIRDLTPAQRLESILWDQQILGFAPFGRDIVQPMVCFSESPLSHLEWLLHGRGWPPWGIVLSRQLVYTAGGGPVWYARPDQYACLTPAQRSWAVNFNTDTTIDSRSDWVHEREWRIPVLPDNPALRLVREAIVAVLVEFRAWQPSPRYFPNPTGRLLDRQSGELTYPGNPMAVPEMQQVQALHPLWGSFPRWYWDPAAQGFTAWPTA